MNSAEKTPDRATYHEFPTSSGGAGDEVFDGRSQRAVSPAGTLKKMALQELTFGEYFVELSV